MNTTLISQVRDGIKARKRHLRQLSETTGVPYSTLVKIGQGAVKNPRIETVEMLMREFGIVCAVPPKPTSKGQ